MAQVTLRAKDDLIERVRASARAAGRSMNDYITFVLDVATDPDLAGSDAERVRERLRRGDLLIAPGDWRRPHRAAISGDELQQAGRRAAQGTPLADLVHEGR